MKTTFMLVAGFALATACHAGNEVAPSGDYYIVPADRLTKLDSQHTSMFTGQRDPNAVVSPTTASVAVSYSDTGTTAIQAVFEVRPGTNGFVLHKQDMPPIVQYAFDGQQDLFVGYDYTSFIRSSSEPFAADLLEADGLPKGQRVTVHNAGGEVPVNIKFYFDRPGTSETEPLDLYSSATLILPRGGLNNHQASSALDRLVAVDSESGTSALYDLKFHLGQAIGLPFLNDWKSSHAKVAIYSGRIYDNYDRPASRMEFKIANDGASITGQSFRTAVDGSFRVAIREQENYFFSVVPGVTLLINEDTFHNRSFRISSTRYNEIRKPDNSTLTVTLLDEEGKPDTMSGTLTSIIPSVTIVGNLMSLTDHRQYPLRLTGKPGQNEKTFIVNDVRVPGVYTANALSRMYHEVEIGRKDTSVTLTPAPLPYSITGTLRDLQDRPIADGRLLFRNENSIYSRELAELSLPRRIFLSMTDSGITDETGEFKISGNYAANLSRILASAPGFGTVLYRPTPLLKTRSVDGFERLEGESKIGTVTLARSATATVRLDENAWNVDKRSVANQPENKLLVNIDFNALNPPLPDGISRLEIGQYNKSSWRSRLVNLGGDKWEMPVPAETTFTIQLHNFVFNSRRGAMINEVFKPGEVRDITSQLSPVTTGSLAQFFR